jgi:hypothetical protein
MGQRLIITESERKEILSKYIMQNVIEEQNKGSIAVNLYNRIKNKPIVKKIESLYDPNLSKFVKNVVSNFPQLKKNETSILQQVTLSSKNPEEFLSKNSSSVDSVTNNQIEEQVGAIILGFVALILLIVIIKNKGTSCQTNTEASKKLQPLVGLTVNLYNGENQQMLYGKVKINDIKFQDCYQEGSRSHIIMNYDWRVECLSNPSRLSNQIDVVERQNVGKTVIKSSSSKYNKEFTDRLQEIAGNFCRKPQADYSSVTPPSSSNLA